MSEFKKQIDNSLKKYIFEFNSRDDLAEIRALYRKNFDKIKGLIQKFGLKPAIEDISNIDSILKNKILNEQLFLQQINRAIATDNINIDDIR